MKKLYRSNKDSMIAGVCGGFAEYYNLDVTVVRMGLVLSALFIHPLIVAYIAGVVVIPEEPQSHREEETQELQEVPDKISGKDTEEV